MLTLSVTGAARAACPRALHPLLRRLESSEIGRRFASGAFWSLLGAVASRFFYVIKTRRPVTVRRFSEIMRNASG